MKFFTLSKDGGPESTVWAYTLIEIKSLFSIVLLRFEDGSRDAYHDHAFNAISWVLSGCLEEENLKRNALSFHWPSFRKVITRRDTFHKVYSHGRSRVLSLRGPWLKTWQEADRYGKVTTLTHGRKPV